MESHEAFAECADVLGDEPLRQGDVFKWHPESSDPWEQFGIIVTADCDASLTRSIGDCCPTSPSCLCTTT